GPGSENLAVWRRLEEEGKVVRGQYDGRLCFSVPSAWVVRARPVGRPSSPRARGWSASAPIGAVSVPTFGAAGGARRGPLRFLPAPFPGTVTAIGLAPTLGGS